MGNMPKPMLIKKDSHGEMNVEEVKGAEAQILTIERVRELTRLDPHNDSRQLVYLPTHEKLLWLKLKIDREAPSVTAGANQIKVDRENLLSDALAAFKGMRDKKKLLQVTFQNEVSRDVGGISREFFSSLMKEMI